MLKIDKTVTVSPEQLEIIMEGVRNPRNSWDRMDSRIQICNGQDPEFEMGANDWELCNSLANAGSVHAKYRRMIPVYVTITAPLYWWKEFDTYKVGTVCNSCSTMHKIQAKEFTMDDFSHEHLFDDYSIEWQLTYTYEDCYTGDELLRHTIDVLNHHRAMFLDTKDKQYWWQMIQLLPSSYNQKRTIMLNYEVLYGIYRDRKNHKLDEWKNFCEWIEGLPYSELISLKRETN